MIEFGGESSGRFQIAGWGIEKRVCLLCGRECAVEADIGVEGGVGVREAVEKGLAEGSVRLPLISAVGGIREL